MIDRPMNAGSGGGETFGEQADCSFTSQSSRVCTCRSDFHHALAATYYASTSHACSTCQGAAASRGRGRTKRVSERSCTELTEARRTTGGLYDTVY